MKDDSLEKIRQLTQSLTKVEDNLKTEYSLLEFILEDTTDGYWDWNMLTNYEYLSPKFKAQLGYKPDEMENSPEAWQAICNKEDLERAIKTVSDHIEGKTDRFTEVLRFTHKNGHKMKVLCSGKIVERKEDGSPIRMIGTHKILDK
jgi:PAS domain S-box-containing protein